MEKINLKKYIKDNNIKSILFMIRMTQSGAISDNSRINVRKIRKGVSNIRFVLFREHLPKVTAWFDLIVADCTITQITKIKKDYKFNHLITIERGHLILENVKRNKLDIKLIPIQQKINYNRLVELRRIGRKKKNKR
ncbi:MAG: hypothetical protein HUJ52_03715 [Malacoplasma sp.]|nr:hypothetical protein [Malacoplasma sp.]